MTKNKKEILIPILINIRYKHSMNKFEECFGENISYAQIEQESYIELKDTLTSRLNRKIKFRKRGREGMVLSVKADMLAEEYEKFLNFIKNKEINFIYEFIISKTEILENEPDETNEDYE